LGTLEGGNIDLSGYSPLLFELQAHLIRIKALADTSTKITPKRAQLVEIEKVSKHALSMLDYALFAIETRQVALPLSPISATAAAQDVMQELASLAKSYDVTLELDVTKRLQPIYAHEAALKGVLHGLAYSAITAQSVEQRRTVTISVQGTQPGQQRLGVFAPGVTFTGKSIERAKAVSGSARLAAPSELYAGGLGLLVSDELSKALHTALTTIRRHKHTGVGFYVSTSNQLQLV
jgi:signal transduction histidine kinase